MLPFEARHVVTSSTGKRVLYGAFEHSVLVRDLATGRDVSTFATTFDFGGRRLALSDQLDAVVAGAAYTHGIALYDASSGLEKWRRKDIKRIQRINLSNDGSIAYCGIEGAPLVVVDLRTSETIGKVKGADSLHVSSYEAIHLLTGRPARLCNADGTPRFQLGNGGIILSSAFLPGAVAISLMCGGVHLLDCGTGRERWLYRPSKDCHVLQLCYSQELGCVLADEWCYKTGGPHLLRILNAETGTLESTTALGEFSACCFTSNGSTLVTSAEQVLQLPGVVS